MSAAERFLRLSPVERRKQLRRWSDAEIEALDYDWRWWARPEQLAPAGQEWVTWGIIAGRGAGKTRSAAEFLRDEVESGREAERVIKANSAKDYREKLAKELEEMSGSEMWRAGAMVRKLRPQG